MVHKPWKFTSVALACLGVIAGATIASASARSSAAVNLVRNGGFETPVTCDSRIFAGGSLDQWTIPSGSIEIGTAACLWQPSTGAQSIRLNLEETGEGSIAQDIPTRPGVKYDVHFALAAAPDSPLPVTLDVLANGKVIGKPRFNRNDTSASNMGWVCPTYDFIARSRKTTVAFVNTTLGSGPAIDDVKVTVEKPGIQIGGVIPSTFFPGSTGVSVLVDGSEFNQKPPPSRPQGVSTRVSFSNPAITVTSARLLDNDHIRLLVNVGNSPASNSSNVTVSRGTLRDTCGNSVFFVRPTRP